MKSNGEIKKNINILLEHLKNNRDLLSQISKNILLDHKGNIGTAREGLISNFLEKNLPELVSYHSGEIFDSLNNKSAQIDIILHPAISPKLHQYGSLHLFPIESVLAAIEVKSKLTKKTLNESLDNIKTVKELQNRNYTDNKEKFNGVPYIVFAYNGFKSDTLFKHLKQYDEHHWLLPELIIVLEKGYYLQKNMDKSLQAGSIIGDVYTIKEDANKVLVGMFSLLIDRIESWHRDPKKIMPIEAYVDEDNRFSYNLLEELF